MDSVKLTLTDLVSERDQLVEGKDPSGFLVLCCYCSFSYDEHDNSTLVEVSNQDYLVWRYPQWTTVRSGQCYLSGQALLDSEDLRKIYLGLETNPIIDEDHYNSFCFRSYLKWWEESRYWCTSELLAAMEKLLAECGIDYLYQEIGNSPWADTAEILRKCHESSIVGDTYWIDDSSEGVSVNFDPRFWSNDLLFQCLNLILSSSAN